jgi:hypothetical protein
VLYLVYEPCGGLMNDIAFTYTFGFGFSLTVRHWWLSTWMNCWSMKLHCIQVVTKQVKLYEILDEDKHIVGYAMSHPDDHESALLADKQMSRRTL